MIDDPTFSVLNAVYLKKMAAAVQVTELTEASAASVDGILAQAIAQGWLMEVEGKFMLLPEGTQAVLDGYDARYGDQRRDERVEDWYRRFETLNGQFIRQVSEWQGDGGERAQGRLMRSIGRLVKSIGELVPSIPRYVGYIHRFEHGLRLIDQGRLEYIANPTLDSVHNVWFEFHEYILSVLSRQRDA
jgi:hypothetical protein